MKYIYLFAIVLVNLFSAQAQRDLTPNKKNKAFGQRDFNDYSYHGIQISLGPTYTLTKGKSEIFSNNDPVRPANYWFEPKGKVGFFLEVGMAHFASKKLDDVKLKLFNTRLISYYDWGLGFKYIGGSEKMTWNDLDAFNAIKSTSTFNGSFYNGYAYGRFTVHNNIYFLKKYFLDNGLGINLDYRVLSANETYYAPITKYTNQPAFSAQLHYSVGIGVKLSRNKFLIPGIQLPIFGFYQWNHSRIDWYSSNYKPLLFQIKYIQLFKVKKKKNGCSQGSEEDRKRNDEYMKGS